MPVAELWLEDRVPIRALVSLRLTPVTGKYGARLRGRVILLDNLKREFRSVSWIFLISTQERTIRHLRESP
jgi:hypothetical protein